MLGGICDAGILISCDVIEVFYSLWSMMGTPQYPPLRCNVYQITDSSVFVYNFRVYNVLVVDAITRINVINEILATDTCICTRHNLTGYDLIH